MTDKKSSTLPSFHIIKIRNSLNEVETVDGFRVRRSEKAWIDDYQAFVKCAPYDNHFVFVDPNWKRVIGRYFAYCTCGSIAVLVGSNAYGQYGSPEGMMLVCHHHTSFGKHLDGGM